MAVWLMSSFPCWPSVDSLLFYFQNQNMFWVLVTCWISSASSSSFTFLLFSFLLMLRAQVTILVHQIILSILKICIVISICKIFLFFNVGFFFCYLTYIHRLQEIEYGSLFLAITWINKTTKLTTLINSINFHILLK